MRRPWWLLRGDAPDEPLVRGERGPGKVLVTTRRDRYGNATEQVWATPEAAADWDETRWHDTP